MRELPRSHGEVSSAASTDCTYSSRGLMVGTNEVVHTLETKVPPGKVVYSNQSGQEEWHWLEYRVGP